MSELDALIARVRGHHEGALQQHVPALLAQVRALEDRVLARVKSAQDSAVLARLVPGGPSPTSAEIQEASRFGHTVQVASLDTDERELLRLIDLHAPRVFCAMTALEGTPERPDGSTAPIARTYWDRATTARDARDTLANLTMFRREIESSAAVRHALARIVSVSADPAVPNSSTTGEGTGQPADAVPSPATRPSKAEPRLRSADIEITGKTTRLGRRIYAVVLVDGLPRRDVLTVGQAEALLDRHFPRRQRKPDKDCLTRARKSLKDMGIDPRKVTVRDSRTLAPPARASGKIRAASH